MNQHNENKQAAPEAPMTYDEFFAEAKRRGCKLPESLVAAPEEQTLTDDAIERAALKHVAPGFRQLAAVSSMDPDYRKGEQFKRLKAFALELFGAAPVAPALTLENAPIGTLAPAIMGGRWYRMKNGWKWNGPDGNGGTFQRPGGDWDGKLIAPVAAPEAPASDTDEFLATLKGAAKEATDEWIAGFVRQHFGIYAATTASASYECKCGHELNVCLATSCEYSVITSAPSRDAAPQIKTWQERAKEAGHIPALSTEWLIPHMESEIADLRAALAQQGKP